VKAFKRNVAGGACRYGSNLMYSNFLHGREYIRNTSFVFDGNSRTTRKYNKSHHVYGRTRGASGGGKKWALISNM
jgi:hypothetical protein